MPFESLIPEILNSIGDFLDEPELKNLARTSRRLHSIFDRILYLSAKHRGTVRSVGEGVPAAGTIRAARRRNVDAMRKFITVGADLNERDPVDERTALHIAADYGHIAMLELLFLNSADPYLHDNRGDTPLDTAIRYGYYETFEHFINHDPGPKAVRSSMDGWPSAPVSEFRPLRKYLLRFLVEGHVDASAFSNMSLVCAALDGDVDDIQALLESGQQDFSERFVMWAAAMGGNIAAVEALLARGFDVNMFSNEDMCPPAMCTALWNSDSEMVRYLHERGAYFNYPNDGPKPELAPAFAAAGSRDLEMVELVASLGGTVVDPDDNPRLGVLITAISPIDASPPLLEDFVPPMVKPQAPFSVPMLQRLVELGADPKGYDDMGRGLLHFAVYENQIPVEGVEFLLQQGANPDSLDYYEVTPLNLAAQNDTPEILEVLLQHGADPNKAANGVLPLCEVSHPGGASLLLEHGASLDEIASGMTPLSSAAARGLPTLMAFFLEKGASLTLADEFGHHPLHCALYSDHTDQVLDMVKLLLQHGAPINMKGGPPCNGEALCHAVTPFGVDEPNLEVVKLMLDHGANIHSYTPDGQNCVHDACCGARFASVLPLLIEYGADLSTKTLDGRSPLHIATARNCPKIVSILLQHGASVDEQMKNGKTPLCLAVEKGYEDIATMLLSHGASPQIGKHNGTGPFHMAVSRGRGKMVSKLLDRGLDVNQPGRDGKTPLMIAALHGDYDIVCTLLHHGANVDATASNGKTALSFAVSGDKHEIASLLRDSGAN